MKKLIFLKTLLPAFILAGSTIAISSCANDETETPREFIYNRSFSFIIRGVLKGDTSETPKTAYGTMWLLDDATKDNNQDYKYWFATNWHVQHAIELFQSETIKYGYGDSSLNTGSRIKGSDYIILNDDSVQWEPLTNFCYPETIEESGPYYIPAIDFYVGSIDFGQPNGKIKNKLNKLNEQKAKKGYFNKFATIENKKDLEHKQLFVGGYPVRTEEDVTGGSWHFNNLTSDLSSFSYWGRGVSQSSLGKGISIGSPDKDQEGNPAGGSEAFYYYDISPQLVGEHYKDSSFLGAGASGSMLVSFDPQIWSYEICGIYWGTWADSAEQRKPAFSIFHSSTYSFIAKYIRL